MLKKMVLTLALTGGLAACAEGPTAEDIGMATIVVGIGCVVTVPGCPPIVAW